MQLLCQRRFTNCKKSHPFFLLSFLNSTLFFQLCFTAFICTFPISLLRVALNKKISSNVAWIQLSVPAVTLYSLTLLSQPSQRQEDMLQASPTAAYMFEQWHLKYEMPLMHGLFACCLLAAVATLIGFYQRWETFKHTPFSPAHAAFCFPILSHGNAVQAYRGVINIFLLTEDNTATATVVSSFAWSTLYMKFVFGYWFLFITTGTILTLVVTSMYLYHLPRWCLPDIDESTEEPPAPHSHTMMQDVLLQTTGEHIRQPYVSPMVLQANETGALVRVVRKQDSLDDFSFTSFRRGSRQHRRDQSFVRTLQVGSLGFEPKLTPSTLMAERDRILEWVAQHPAPRPRHVRTLSHPIGYGSTSGTAGSNVTAAVNGSSTDAAHLSGNVISQHNRANTHYF
jgi:hypothetical protein